MNGKSLPTVGEISRRLNQPIHRVEYIIRARGIESLGMAGNARVFSESAIKRIASELKRVDDERDGES